MPDYYLVSKGEVKLSDEQYELIKKAGLDLETAYKREVWIAFKSNYTYANEESIFMGKMKDEQEKEALLLKAQGFAHMLMNANAPIGAISAIFNHARQFRTHPTATNLLKSWKEICEGWGLSEKQKIKLLLESKHTEYREFDENAHSDCMNELKNLGLIK